MKQRKFGKKIQNWHRPPGPSELPQRFRRHRYDHAGVTKPGEDPHYTVEADLNWRGEGDEYWNLYDPRADYRCSHDNELFSHHLDHLWQAITDALHPHMDVGWPRDDRADGTSENLGLAAAPDQTIPSDLVERLGAHIVTLTRFSAEDSFVLRQRIAVAIGDPRNLEIVKAEYARTPEAAKRVCLFAPFWRRSPQTWNPKSGTTLLDHLFVHYPVPRFLYREWCRDLYPGWGAYYADDERAVERGTPGFKWLCWFILLGQGGSLRRAAEWFEWRIPARFQPGLYEAPCGVSPVEACVFAEVRRLGGSETDGMRILRNPAFVVDPTEFSAVESYGMFWQDTVRWLIAHRDAVTDEQSHQILSWAMHQYTEAERLIALEGRPRRPRRGRGAEAERRGAQPFTWKGRRVRTVLKGASNTTRGSHAGMTISSHAIRVPTCGALMAGTGSWRKGNKTDGHSAS